MSLLGPKLLSRVLRTDAKAAKRKRFRNSLVENLEDRRVLTSELGELYGPAFSASQTQVYTSVDGDADSTLTYSQTPDGGQPYVHRTMHFDLTQARPVALDYADRLGAQETGGTPSPSSETIGQHFEYELTRINVRDHFGSVLDGLRLDELHVVFSGDAFAVTPSIEDGELQFAVSGKHGFSGSATIWLTDDANNPVAALDVFVRNGESRNATLEAHVEIDYQSADAEFDLEGEGESSGSGGGSGSSAGGSGSSSGSGPSSGSSSTSSTSSSSSGSSSGSSSYCHDTGVCCPPGHEFCQFPEDPHLPFDPNELYPQVVGGGLTTDATQRENLFVRAGVNVSSRQYETLDASMFQNSQQFSSDIGTLNGGLFSAGSIGSLHVSIPSELQGLVQFEVHVQQGPLLESSTLDRWLTVEVLGQIPSTAVGAQALIQWFDQDQILAGCTTAGSCSGRTDYRRYEATLTVVPDLVVPTPTDDQYTIDLHRTPWDAPGNPRDLVGSFDWSNSISSSDFASFAIDSVSLDFVDDSLDGDVQVLGNGNDPLQFEDWVMPNYERLPVGDHAALLSVLVATDTHRFADGAPAGSMNGYDDEFWIGRSSSTNFEGATSEWRTASARTLMQTVPPKVGLTGWRTRGTSDFRTHPQRQRVLRHVLLEADHVEHYLTIDFPVILSVSEHNSAPEFHSRPPRSVIRGNEYEYQVIGHDKEGDAIVYSLESGPAGMVMHPDGRLIWPTDGDSPAFADVTVRVTDSSDTTLYAEQSYRIDVNGPMNQPPYFQSTNAPTTFVAGVTYTYQVDAMDDEGDAIVYELINPTPGMTINSQTGAISWPTSSSSPSEVDVEIRISDPSGSGLSNTYAYVLGANQPPHFIANAPPHWVNRGSVYSYQFDASDVDGDTIQYSFATSDAMENFTLSQVGNLATVSWVTDNDSPASLDVTVSITDPLGSQLSNSHSFRIDVIGAPNQPPYFVTQNPPQAVTRNQTYEYLIDAKDPEGDAITYRLLSGPTWLQLDDPANPGSIPHRISGTPGPGDSSGLVAIQIEDETGSQKTSQFTYWVTIEEPVANVPPTLVKVPAASVELDFLDEFSFRVLAVDPMDTDDGTLEFYLQNAPAGMSIHPSTGWITWNQVTGSAPNIVVGVRDSEFAFDEATFSVTMAAPNRPPEFVSVPKLEAYLGKHAYQSDVEALDPDGDTVSIQVLEPATARFEASGSGQGNLTWTPTALDRNRWVPFRLQAMDSRGAVVEQNFNVFVHADPENNPPVITSVPTVRLEIPGQSKTKLGGVSIVDPLGQSGQDQLQFQLAGPSGGSPTGQTATATLEFTLDSAPPLVDVMLLLDDTGSFSAANRALQGVFESLVSTLETGQAGQAALFPDTSFGYGVSRFEDFHAHAMNGNSESPFLLNQPILTSDQPRFGEVLDSSLNRTSRGYGGDDGFESWIEALYQLASGAGLDNDLNGSTFGNGPAGSLYAQTIIDSIASAAYPIIPADSGDVPASHILQNGETVFAFDSMTSSPFRVIDVNQLPVRARPAFADEVFASGQSYSVGTRVVHSGKVYEALQFNVATAVTDTAVWQLVDDSPLMSGQLTDDLQAEIARIPSQAGESIWITVDSSLVDSIAVYSSLGTPLTAVSVQHAHLEPWTTLEFRSRSEGTLTVILDRLSVQGLVEQDPATQDPVERALEQARYADTNFSVYAARGHVIGVPTWGHAKPLELDRFQSLSVDEGSTETFVFDSLEPSVFLLNAQDVGSQVSWELFDAQGNSLRSGSLNDLELITAGGAGGGSVQQGAYTFEHAGHGAFAAGKYYLEFSNESFLPFETEFRLMVPQATTAEFEFGQPASFPIEQLSDFVFGKFSGQAGSQVSISVSTTTNEDYSLTLLTPNGQVWWQQGYGGQVDGEVELPMDGNYLAILTSADVSGGFQAGDLNVTTTVVGQQDRPDIQQLDLALPVEHTVLWNAHESELVTFDVPDGAMLYFDGLSAGGRARVDYYDAAGEMQFSLLNSEQNRLLAPATYDQSHYLSLEPIDLISDVPETRIGGGGFRPGALPVILLTSDSGTRFAADIGPDGCVLDHVTGFDGTQVNLRKILGNSFIGLGTEHPSCPAAEPAYNGLTSTNSGATPSGAASVQDAVSALNDIGALVIGLGLSETGAPAISLPRTPLIEMARLTGALDQTATTPEPIYIELNDSSSVPLDQSIALAINSALTNVAYDIEVSLPDSGIVSLVNPLDAQFTVSPGGTNQIELSFEGDGGAHSFYVEFLRKGTNVVLGRMPVSINYSYNYDVTAMDADGDVLSYSLVGEDHGASINPATGVISWLPPANPEPQYQFEVQVEDGRGGFGRQIWVVDVVDAGANNLAPVVQPVEDSVAIVGRTLEFQVDATDPDGDALRFQFDGTTLPAGNPPAIHAESGLFRWTPSITHVNQSFDITVLVDDGRGGETPQTFTIDVRPDTGFGNRAPLIRSQPNDLAVVGEQYTYPLDVQDPDGDQLAFQLAMAPDSMVLNPLTRTIAWKPTADDVGTHTVLVVVSDEFGATDYQRYSLRVSTANLAPRFTSTPTTQFGLDQVGNWLYPITTLDPNDDPVSLSLVKAPPGMVLRPWGDLEWAPTTPGFYDVELVASDSRGGSTTQAFTLQVVALTIPPPTILPGSQPTGPALLGERWAYSVSASRSDNKALNFELLDAPAGMKIEPLAGGTSAEVSWVPAADGGNYRVHVWVSYQEDPTIGVAQIYELPVTFPNTPPIIRSVPYDAVVGNPWTYDLDVVDPDGHDLEYELLIAQPGMTIDENGRITWTPNYVDYQLGRYEKFKTAGRPDDPIVKVAIRDGFGGEVTDEVFAAVQPPIYDGLAANSPLRNVPFVRNNPTGPIYVDQEWTFDLNGIDPNGDSSQLKYRFVALHDDLGPVNPADDGDILVDQDTGHVRITMDNPNIELDNPKYKYEFEIEDEEGWIRKYEMQMRFRNPPADWPTFANAPATSPTKDVAWSHTPISNPAGATFGKSADSVGTLAGGVFSFTPTIMGTHPLVLTATNGAQLADGSPVIFRQATTLVASSTGFITSIPAVSVLLEENAKYEYQMATSHPATSYELLAGPDGMTLDTDGLITWRPTEFGNYPVVVSASGAAGSATQEFKVSAYKPYKLNQPPEIISTPVEIAERDVNYEYQVEFVDANQDAVTFSLNSDRPAWMNIDPQSGLITGTPDKAGQFSVVVTADENGSNLSTSQEFTVTVLHNARPKILSQPSEPARAFIGGADYVYSGFQFSDPNSEDAGNLTVSLVNSAFDMTFDETDPANKKLIFNVPASQSYLRGRHDVTVRVTDPGGAYADQTFSLQALVHGLDVAPEITSHVRSTLVAGWPYELQVTAFDLDGDTIEYSLVQPEPAGAQIDTATGILTWTPPSSLIDSQVTFQIVATSVRDGVRIDSPVQVTQVTVRGTPDNSAPIITSQPIVAATAFYEYDYRPTGTDADNDALYWSLLKSPNGMTVDQASGQIRWIPKLDDVGFHDVQVLVSDGYGGVAEQEFQLLVRSSNLVPTLTKALPRYVAIDPAVPSSAFSMELEVHDEEANEIYFRFENDTLEVDSSTGELWSKYVWDAAQPNHFIRVNYRSGIVEWDNQDGHGTERSAVLTIWDRRSDPIPYPFTIASFDPGINSPPTIDTGLPKYLVINEPKTVPVTVSDNDGDSQHVYLKNAPPGLTFDSVNSELVWSPTTSTQPGEYWVTLVARELGPSPAFEATRSLKIEVLYNLPPEINGIQDFDLIGGQVLQMRAFAKDPDGDPVLYSATALDTSIPGNTTTVDVPIDDKTGEIFWKTPAGTADWHVTVTATDYPYGSSSALAFGVLTTADSQNPSVDIRFQPDPVEVGQDVRISVIATDDVEVNYDSLQLVRTTGGISESIALDANGTVLLNVNNAPWLAQTASQTFVASALDSTSNSGSVTKTLQLVNSPPQIDLKSPTYNQEVYDLVSVYGSITDPQGSLASYTVEVYAQDNPQEKTLIKEVTNNPVGVTDTTIATFDPTLLENGLYTLLVTAVDNDGNASQRSVPISLEGNYKPGVLSLSFADLEIPTSDIPLTVTRSYSSANAKIKGDFGYGWTLDLGIPKVEIAYLPEANPTRSGYSTMLRGTRVTVTLPDGTREGFTFDPVPERTNTIGLVLSWLPYFRPDEGNTIFLDVKRHPLHMQKRADDTEEFVDFVSRESYHPAQQTFGGYWQVLTHGGPQIYVDGTEEDRGWIEDRNGNKTTIAPNGITHWSGRSVRFVRNADGFIEQVIDPSNKAIHYTYSNGNLIKVTDRPHAVGQPGAETQYVYGDMIDETTTLDPGHTNFLTKILDDLGRTQLSAEYYNSRRQDYPSSVTELQYLNQRSRLSKLIDVESNTSTFEFDLSDRSQGIQSSSGANSSVVLDRRGNPIETVDGADVVVRSRYDHDGNLIEQRQVLGTPDRNNGLQDDLVSTYRYNQYGQPVLVTDASGLATGYGYNSQQLVSSVAASGGQVTTYDYDQKGNLTVAKSPLGESTKLAYGYRGLLRTVKNDDDLQLVHQEYDYRGNLVATTDTNGNQTQFEYNQNGFQTARLSDQKNADGTVTLKVREETDYDDLDRVTHRRLMHLAPDANGDFVDQPANWTTVWETTTTYDPGTGLVISEVDQHGLTTKSRYDQRGNVIEVIREVNVRNSLGNLESHWATQRTVFNAEGQVQWATDSYQSDSLGTPVNGWANIGVSETGYDNGGRVVETRRHQSVAIDITGGSQANSASTADITSAQLVSSTATEYDSAGRVVRTRDANGLWTETYYGFGGQVVQTRSQVLDENGNVVHLISRSLTDSLGRPLFSLDSFLEEHTATATIENRSFENDSLTSGAATSTVSGWTVTGTAGALHTDTTHYLNSGPTQGEQVGYTNGGTLTQSLAKALEPNRTYELSVDVGRPLGVGVPTYSVGLYAGGTLLKELTQAEFALNGDDTLVTASLQYISPPRVDAGQLLELRLSSPTNSIVHFDSVQLSIERSEASPGLGTKVYYDELGRTVKTENREGIESVLLDHEGAIVDDYATAKGPFSVQVLDQGSVTSTTRSVYNAKGQLSHSLSSTGATTQYEYDDQGRQIRQIGAAVATVESQEVLRLVTETEYDQQGRAFKTRTNIRGRDMGNRILFDSRFAIETVHEYDEQGRVAQTITAAGTPEETTTSFTYDAFGNVVSEMTTDKGSSPAAPPKTFEYLNGQLEKVTLPAVQVDSNANGQLDPADSSANPVFEYRYDWSGNQTSIRDSMGRETKFTFDAAGRQLTRTLPLGIGQLDGYVGSDPRDLAGQPAAFTEAFYYNERGQQIRHVSFEDVVTEWEYDNGTTHLDALDPNYRVGTGMLTEQRFYADSTVYSGGAGTPDEVWKFNYDAMGRKTQLEVSRLGTVTRVENWLYDSNGRLVQAVSAEGVVNYAYDNATGLKTRMWTTRESGLESGVLADVIDDTRYGYNQIGWLTEVTVVEKNDHVLSTSSHERTVYGHDLLGRQLRVDLPNGAVELRHVDNLSQITQVRHYGPDATPHDLGDNPIRSEFNTTLENGQRTQLTETFYFDHDGDGGQFTADIAKSTTYDWVYDANDRLLSETIDHHDDALDRTESFVMDLFGNRTNRAIDYADPTAVDQAFAYSYDDNDRLTTETLDESANGSIDQTTRYSWDSTQQTAKEVFTGSSTNPADIISSQSFSYDLQGRLADVITTPETGPATKVTYSYDSFGIRVSSSQFTDANSNDVFETSELDHTIDYLVDHHNHTGYAQTITETTTDSNGDNVKRVTTTFGTDELSQTTYTPDPATADAWLAEAMHFFGHDAHGSVRILLDVLGEIAQTFTYSAYGELLAIYDATGMLVGTLGAADTSAALTNLLYSGESFDSRIGQQYLRARWYNATAGRFSRLDPYFGTLNDPLSFNKYNYAHSSPIASVDPTGLSTLSNISLSISIGTTIAGSMVGGFQALNGYISGEFSAGQAWGVWAKWTAVSAGFGLAGGLGLLGGSVIGLKAVLTLAGLGLISIPSAAWYAGRGDIREGLGAMPSGLTQSFTDTLWAARTYQTEIITAGIKHGIPPELLASVLTAERQDYSFIDWMFDDSNFGEGFARHSIGLAQIRIDNVTENWHIRGWDESTPHWQVRAALMDHGESIDVLAEVLSWLLQNASLQRRTKIEQKLANWNNLSSSQREDLVFDFAGAKDAGSLDRSYDGLLTGQARKAYRQVRELGIFAPAPSS